MHALGRRTMGLALTCMVVLLFLPPSATADSELMTRGVVGVHSLLDTRAKPGVTCQYQVVDAWIYNFATRLKTLTVRPPRIFAASGRQRVGWRFVVVRERLAEDGRSTRRTYASPWQYATASASREAVFTPMQVAVAVPRDGRRDRGAQYNYVIRVQMTWYGPHGWLVGSSSHRVDWYRSTANLPILGHWIDNGDYPCDGWFGWLIN